LCDNCGAISVYNGAYSQYVFGVTFYTCGRTPSCTCFVYSFSGCREKKFICRQNWNTQ